MIDWRMISRDLQAMREHFTECAGNAQPGSEARARYAGYVRTLTRVAAEVEEKTKEEDDGK